MVEPISATAATAAAAGSSGAPAWLPAALSAAGGALGGLGQFGGGAAQAKALKRQAKETKRRTLADLLNAALSREFEAGEGIRKRGADLASARASALQNIASQYVQALR